MQVIMAWIKFEKDLLTDPRVLRIAAALEDRWEIAEETLVTKGEEAAICNGPPLPAVTLVCGALVRLWALADTHLDSEDTLPLGTDEIDKLIGLPGFCDLLPEDWLVEIDDDNVKLPDFHIHNGTEAKKKAQNQKRVERFRAKSNAQALPSGNGRALPDQTRPRPEKTTPNSSSTAANVEERKRFLAEQTRQLIAKQQIKP